MPRDDHDNTTSTIPTVGDAITALNAAVAHHTQREHLADAVVAAWQDLDFDDRRYLGTSFPKLTTTLIDLENA